MSVKLTQKEIKLLKEFTKTLDEDLEDEIFGKSNKPMRSFEEVKKRYFNENISDMTLHQIIEYVKTQYTVESYMKSLLEQDTNALGNILNALIKYYGEDDKKQLIWDIFHDYFDSTEVKEFTIEILSQYM